MEEKRNLKMLSSKNGFEYKHDFSSKEFKIAFDFLKRTDLAELEVGWYELGDGVRASVQRYTSFLWDENRFETHEKFFDVQYVVEGMECCGVCDRSQLGEVAVPYNEENDITFIMNQNAIVRFSSMPEISLYWDQRMPISQDVCMRDSFQSRKLL